MGGNRDKTSQSMLEKENDERISLLNERVASLRNVYDLI